MSPATSPRAPSLLATIRPQTRCPCGRQAGGTDRAPGISGGRYQQAALPSRRAWATTTGSPRCRCSSNGATPLLFAAGAEQQYRSDDAARPGGQRSARECAATRAEPAASGPGRHRYPGKVKPNGLVARPTSCPIDRIIRYRFSDAVLGTRSALVRAARSADGHCGSGDGSTGAGIGTGSTGSTSTDAGTGSTGSTGLGSGNGSGTGVGSTGRSGGRVG